MKCMRCGELDASLCTRCVGELTELSDWDLCGPDLLAVLQKCRAALASLDSEALGIGGDGVHDLP